MFNEYPYLNLNDFNLDYILKAIKEMRYEVTNFVSINAIKYADPIQWNITSQYEKNTIVIDPVTGTAYISVAPVPAGVALTRPEYWTVVFDLGSFVTRAAQNFTSRWESDTTTTATFSTPAGAWLVWGDVLYKALVNITAGDAYVVNSNIEHITIEDVINTIAQDIANEAQARQDADDAINTTIGDLNDLETTDKTSIVNAINDVNAGLTQEVIDRGNAINAAKTYINVKIYGATGDGVTDDTTAIQNALDNNHGALIYFPKGVYIVTAPIVIPNETGIIGDGFESIIKQANGANLDYIIKSVNFDNLKGANHPDHGIREISIIDIAINGNWHSDWAEPSHGVVNNTIGCGIGIYGSSLYFNNISVYNCADNGIYTEGSSYESPLLAPHATESLFYSVRSNFNGKHGWKCSGPHDSKFFGLLIGSNSQSNDITYSNFICDSSWVTGAMINCHFYMTWTETYPSETHARRVKNSLTIENGNGWRFSNCDFEGGGYSNVELINVNAFKFVNCTLYAGTGSTDLILNGATNCSFANCLFTTYNALPDDGGVHSWAGAVSFAPNSGNTRNSFIGCELYDTHFSVSTANDGGDNVYILSGSSGVGGLQSFNNNSGDEVNDVVICLGTGLGENNRYIYIPNQFEMSHNGIARPFQYNIVDNVKGQSDIYSTENIMINGYTTGTLHIASHKAGTRVYLYNRVNDNVPIDLSNGDINGAQTVSLDPLTTRILFFYEDNNAIIII